MFLPCSIHFAVKVTNKQHHITSYYLLPAWSVIDYHSPCIQVLLDGADGIWASLCIEGASMGNASSCVTLMNLVRFGNKKVLKKFNCQYLRQAAINITKLTTGLSKDESKEFNIKSSKHLSPKKSDSVYLTTIKRKRTYCIGGARSFNWQVVIYRPGKN